MATRCQQTPQPNDHRDATRTGWNTRAAVRFGSALVGLVLGLGSTGCTGGSAPTAGATAAATSSPATGPAAAAHWTPYRSVRAVLDLTQPRQDGRLTVAAAGRLSLLGGTGQPAPFAQAGGGYSTALGPEPYIALATGTPTTAGACAFARDTVYALEPGGQRGVIAVTAQGQASRVVNLPGVAPTGIAFDTTGRFGYRLLVTAAVNGGTMVYAIDCASRVTTIAEHAPAGEGGIVVAPQSFGSYGGDLILPDEKTGRIWAIAPDGRASLVARSPLASGGDIGVESAGFVPAGLTPAWAAYLADRASPGNPHPGSDSILRLPAADLIAAGVAPGDLVVASEGGAQTVAVRCAATCALRHVADGPATSHAEGHIVFAPPLP